MVFLDLDGDCFMDANESAVEGVTIVITLADGSTATTVTDANGEYSFTNLPAGTYTVSIEDAPAGTTFGNSSAYTITLEAGDAYENGDFCLKPTGASIGDFVWYDLDLDGIQDADEPGIPGVEVTLTYPDGTTETLITNSSGEYLFSNLEAGEYTVTVLSLIHI